MSDSKKHPKAANTSEKNDSSFASSTAAATVQQSNLKFPYPVLNDKRDYKEIMRILDDKEADLKKKIQQAKLSYKMSSKDDKKRKEKLKTMYNNIKGQLAKIEKQLEYIKLNLKIKKITKLRTQRKEQDYKEEQLQEMNKKLNKLVALMKEENKKFLADNKEKLKTMKLPNQQQSMITNIYEEDIKEPVPVYGPATAPADYFRQVPPPHLVPPAQNASVNPYNLNPWNLQQPTSVGYHSLHHNHRLPVPPPPPPFNLAQQRPHQFAYNQQQFPPVMVSQSLPAISTTTTAAAATTTTNSLAIASQSAQLPKADVSSIINSNLTMAIAQTAAAAHAAAAISAAAYYPPPPPNEAKDEASMPNKSVIDQASSTFSLLKDKISNFLGTDKSVIKYTDSLKTLTAAYHDEDDDDDDIEDNDNNDKKIEAKKVIEKSDEESSDGESDLEIQMTSNSRKLNYILPPNKACGLQASMMFKNEHNRNKFANLNFLNSSTNKPLLAAQSSSCSLTFMGVPSIITNKALLSNILYKNKE